jgi:hypothetical protein
MPQSTERKSPPFPLGKIYKNRDNLYGLLHPFVGKVPEKETFEQLCQAVGAAFLISPKSQAVFETVRTLPASPLTAKVLWLFAWRVAANATKLRHGEPVRPWSAQVDDEWVALEILGIRFERHESFGPRYVVELRAMSGTCAGLTMTQMWAASAILEHARRFGFTKVGKKKLTYRHASQFARLRCAAQISAKLSLDRPRFRGYVVEAGLLKFNKDILKQRIRREPPCPQKFTHHCHVCPVGWAVGEITCPAAVHPATWEMRPCPGCNQERWFDPSKSAYECMVCLRRKAEESEKKDE